MRALNLPLSKKNIYISLTWKEWFVFVMRPKKTNTWREQYIIIHPEISRILTFFFKGTDLIIIVIYLPSGKHLARLSTWISRQFKKKKVKLREVYKKGPLSQLRLSLVKTTWQSVVALALSRLVFHVVTLYMTATSNILNGGYHLGVI
jgi:hypothetical protein